MTGIWSISPTTTNLSQFKTHSMTPTEIFVTLAVLVTGLILSVYWEMKSAKDEMNKQQQEANRKEIDRLLSFDERDIYR